MGSVIALRIQDVSRTNHISRQVTKATGVAAVAAKAAEEAAKAMLFLSETTSRIGDVATTIGKVAKQTNLLALNATIEAGRAGDMGVGFAVVAQEVKLLSGQTAKATTDIGSQVGKVQGAANEMRRAMDAMNNSINDVSAIVTDIASAIQEPG
ncbi:methyl-accepting chemotaxis protein [[Pseudomonas] carboxydohydrogena]|uniref:Methyl-accepting chemotaxis protein n=1 Tax=Afipia carboxydohydrogena TaxID=290 RepID=A0ABY8BT30_AFICR|nr:methyl-accepting chemotaxis protein [[Pseudomonas] carboxydohydrogena]